MPSIDFITAMFSAYLQKPQRHGLAVDLHAMLRAYITYLHDYVKSEEIEKLIGNKEGLKLFVDFISTDFAKSLADEILPDIFLKQDQSLTLVSPYFTCKFKLIV